MSAHPDHRTDDFYWTAKIPLLEEGAALHRPAHEQATAWLADLLPAAGVRRVLDVGSGPGVATTFLLADSFPEAEVVAVDGTPALLERAREHAERRGLADRVRTLHADLPADFGTLGAADVVWSSHAVHHLGDQQAALNALAATLRPGGLLAVAERGLPARYLPRDIGMGRPGLLARLDAAEEDGYTTMREELPGSTPVVEDWPAMLAAAGLVPSGSRTFLIDRPAPLDAPVREQLHARLSHLRDQIGTRLDSADRATLDRLLDRESREGILWRPDAFYLMAITVHTARSGPPEQ
ncbi:class I SAM-dependent methyltransferase [Marinitenerispora sediminis]|uniref:Class I SAM-dependent methyltransferase n=1 Tax=Marinitenerispora sediminis TaxID=1931232 RepID=A0A368T4G9_9ACTN|nr:class I SAM-dependent methyltransferase [Marinitenerispora sediminis]RCV50299.1 class I SAM-dependent methyltransferase [Marinitenerispora sediminis]RCV53766.1 class I SAM-dependent methyltransferase [Marinitenerispora sediminis]RCV58055.1 class I SAM-dependent methyltransferase [Marinitenerispora sediminis]